MPHAFFGTFFRVERKYYPPSGRQPHPLAPESARQAPTKGEFLAAELPLFMQAGWLSARPPAPPSGSRRTNAGVCACGRTKGLSSGQTIGAVRTAVRSACCLPELRVANRLRRLCPLGDGELFKFNLKSSVCQRQTGLPKGNPPCVFPSFPFGNLRSPLEAIERPIGLQALLLRRSRRINPHQRGISSAEVSLCGTRRRHPSS